MYFIYSLFSKVGFKLNIYPRQGRLCIRRCLSVRLFVSNFAKKIPRTDLHESFREGWQWDNEQMIKFWLRFGSPSGYRDCCQDSSLLGDTESGINLCLLDAAVMGMH